MFTVILTHLNKGLSKLETQANHDPRKDAWTKLEMEMRWEELQQMNSSGTSDQNVQWVGAQEVWVLKV